MSKPLTVCKNPCTTCPYRKDVPSGLWHFEEYEKLRQFDEVEYDRETFKREDFVEPCLAVFLCHNTLVVGEEVACKGWLMVHKQSIAVRLAILKGEIDPATAFEKSTVKLFRSGKEAADSGQRGIERPGKKTAKAFRRLAKTGRFKME